MAQAVKFELVGDNSKLLRSLAQSERKLQEMEKQLRDVRREGKRNEDQFSSIGRSVRRAFNPANISAFATSMVSIGGAVSFVNQGLAETVRQMTAVSGKSQQAMRDLVAFAAIQETGQIRGGVNRVAALASRFGNVELGRVASLTQSLQSGFTTGTPEQRLDRALAGAETVLHATRLGVPIESVQMLEQIGGALGADPGSSTRRAFLAGQASRSDPAMIARGAAALNEFDDAGFAFEVMGAISAVKPRQVETFARNAGIALSGTSDLRPLFDRLGVGQGATRRERLEAMRQAGILTADQLKSAGLGAQEQRTALGILLREGSVGTMAQIRRDIATRDRPGLLAGDRARVEAENPEMAQARRIENLEAEFANMMSIGPIAQAANEQVIRQRATAIGLVRSGMTRGGFGFMPTTTAEGELAPFGAATGVGQRMIAPGLPMAGEDITSTLFPFMRFVRAVGDMAEFLEQTNRAMQEGSASGGAGEVPTNEDL